MKNLLLTTVLTLLAATGFATVVSVNASSTGSTTTSTKTSGTITVTNTTDRGYAVYDLSSAGIPAAATINSVALVFVHTVSGTGNPTREVYGYVGNISSLSAAALYSGAVTSDLLYTDSWGNASTTKTLSSTANAVSFIQSNHTGTISTTWVESGSGSRNYTITGGSSPYLQITYTCTTPSGVSISPSSNPVCSGSSETLTGNATGGSTYSWSGPNGFTSTAQNPAAFTTSTASAGTYTFTATSTCNIATIATVTLTVNTNAPAAISGASAVCEVASISLTNAVSGGTWSSSNTSRATVSTGGTVTGVSSGSVTISYATGCGTATKAVTVNASPTSISGTTLACTGVANSFNASPGGGTWSSTNTSVATVSTGGVVTGVSQGFATISYTKSGCALTLSDTIKAAPAAISGTTTVCNGSTSTLSNTSNYGTWSTSNSAIASVNATSGLVTSVAAGSATITYNNSCGSAVTATFTVEQAPASIGGATSVCTGNTTALTQSVSGGTWSTSNSAVASVNTSGLVYGISAGSASISYSLTNSCGTNVATKAMTVSQTGLWLGTNTNWNDASNWPCGNIPTASTNVTIPSGTSFLPSFSGATFSMNNLTVAAGVTLTVNSGATLDINGDVSNNAIINGDGVVELSGGSAQTIYGKGTFSNLTINNASGVTLNSGDTVRLTKALSISNGTFTTNSGLRLVSNASGSARIAQITSGNISGNVNIEQYLLGGRRAYRFFAHPFTASIPLSMVGANLDVTGLGGAGNGFTPTASNAASCYRYNPLIGNSSLPSDPGWKAFLSANGTNDTNEFKRHQGIRLFVRGAKGEGLGYVPYTPSATTIYMMGQVNTGTQVITLHKGPNSDYNMVGNPYASPTDIGAAIATAQGAGQIAGSAFYVWNPFLGAAGAFEPKTIGGSYVIDQNTSFQVRAANEGSTLTISESHKAATANESLLRTASQYISLKVVDANNHPWDMMFLSFNENATNNEDSKYDATKAMNPDLNFYSYAGNTKFAVDARPYTNSTIIPIGFTTNYAQQYTIKAENVVLPEGATLFLHDKMLNQYTLLQAGASYSFDITNDKATQGENRFELTANNGAAVAANNTGLNVTMSPNPATDKVTIAYTTDANAATTVNVMNVAGVSVIAKTLGSDASGKVTIALNELPAGIYMVEVASGDNKKVQKLVKE